ncbi:putative membrane protein [Piscirickettsia salmonis LF-89 = ATCC VR-1361]|nr:putative membrane protein [Piscirickettsia salmonis LF-89 = ATCC VR-1361]
MSHFCHNQGITWIYACNLLIFLAFVLAFIFKLKNTDNCQL